MAGPSKKSNTSPAAKPAIQTRVVFFIVIDPRFWLHCSAATIKLNFRYGNACDHRGSECVQCPIRTLRGPKAPSTLIALPAHSTTLARGRKCPKRFECGGKCWQGDSRRRRCRRSGTAARASAVLLDLWHFVESSCFAGKSPAEVDAAPTANLELSVIPASRRTIGRGR